MLKRRIDAKSASTTANIFMMHFHDQVLSEEDFEQLPPTLRRKVSVITSSLSLGPPMKISSLPEHVHHNTITEFCRSHVSHHWNATVRQNVESGLPPEMASSVVASQTLRCFCRQTQLRWKTCSARTFCVKRGSSHIPLEPLRELQER